MNFYAGLYKVCELMAFAVLINNMQLYIRHGELPSGFSILAGLFIGLATVFYMLKRRHD